MNEEQKYLFDLQGYLHLKNVVPPELVARCQQALDAVAQAAPEDLPAPVCHGKPRNDSELYVSNILEADTCFEELIDLPNIISLIDCAHLGLYRLNHTYAIYRWQNGFTPLHMQGTPIHPKALYLCRNGEIFCQLTKVLFPMVEERREDGCFAVVPGSHKSNFPRPYGDDPRENPTLMPIEANPGDAIFFTEALTHGSFPNQSGRPRRNLYYCYSAGFMPDWSKLSLHFSDALMQRLTPARQQIVKLKSH